MLIWANKVVGRLGFECRADGPAQRPSPVHQSTQRYVIRVSSDNNSGEVCSMQQHHICSTVCDQLPLRRRPNPRPAPAGAGHTTRGQETGIIVDSVG